jgi:hypothetical protein
MARLLDLSMGLNGRQRLTIELDSDFRSEFDDLHDVEVDVKVTKHRVKRSLDANAYAWVLVDKIAQKRRMSKAEVYRNAIREIGGVSEVVCIQNRAVKTMKDVWTRNGIGWQVEEMESKIEGCTNLILYKGSSVYDSRQMSALIDSLVQDAKSIGIETRPQWEIDSLLKEFDKC